MKKITFVLAVIFICSLIPSAGFAQDCQCPYSINEIQHYTKSIVNKDHILNNTFNIHAQFDLEWIIFHAERIVNNPDCQKSSGSLRMAIKNARDTILWVNSRREKLHECFNRLYRK